jgi:serine/threonine protein kinase
MQSFEITEGIRVVNKISEGATSDVYRAFSTQDLGYVSQNTPLAIKLFRQMPTVKARERFEREVKIGLSFNSKFLVKYYRSEVYNTGLEQRPFIIMEFIEGPNLNVALTYFKGTDEERDSFVLRILNDILNGLKILHDDGIIHRDLQPNNILIRNGNGVLIDFGVSKSLMKDSPTSLWEEIGSRRYWAPECIEPIKKRWFPETDVFMLASCFIHMLSGKYLFHDAKNYPDFFDKLRRFSKGEVFIPEVQDLTELSQLRSRQIFRAMLAPFPDERPNVEEVLRHLVDGTTPQLESIEESSDYPLSECLWHIESDDELRVLLFLGKLFKSDTPHSNISLKDLQSIITETAGSRGREFSRFIQKLATWGILKQVNEEAIYFYHYGERISINGDGLFTPCLAAQKISRELSQPLTIWNKIQGARREILSSIKDGLCKHRHSGKFDYLTYKKNNYVIDPCDHETWMYRLAIQEKLFVPKLIPNVKREQYRVPVESM